MIEYELVTASSSTFSATAHNHAHFAIANETRSLHPICISTAASNAHSDLQLAISSAELSCGPFCTRSSSPAPSLWASHSTAGLSAHGHAHLHPMSPCKANSRSRNSRSPSPGTQSAEFTHSATLIPPHRHGRFTLRQRTQPTAPLTRSTRSPTTNTATTATARSLRSICTCLSPRCAAQELSFLPPSPAVAGSDSTRLSSLEDVTCDGTRPQKYARSSAGSSE